VKWHPERLAYAAYARTVQGMNCIHRLIELLKANGTTTAPIRDIADTLGNGRRTVVAALSQLHAAGLITYTWDDAQHRSVVWVGGDHEALHRDLIMGFDALARTYGAMYHVEDAPSVWHPYYTTTRVQSLYATGVLMFVTDEQAEAVIDHLRTLAGVDQ
jgi:hypothetical protein